MGSGETNVDTIKRTTFKRYRKAVMEARGNVSLACEKLGVGRSAFYKVLHASEGLRQTLEEAREALDDEVEHTFMKTMLGDEAAGTPPNLTAMIFYMKTRMRYRGYGEKLYIDHSVEGIINAWERLSPEEQDALIARLEADEKLN
jgi:hypothetical protein